MASEHKNISAKLELGDEISFLTRGGSMQPLFVQHRDVVNVCKVSVELKRGDVVLYPSKCSDELILHRIIKVSGDNLLIRGDNNYFNEHRKTNEMVGIMTSFFRKGKYCDVNKSLKYKTYSFYILNTYLLRKIYHAIKVRLSKIKSKIEKKHYT